MPDFQRIHFSKKKGFGNVPPLLSNQIVKINLLSQIIRFQINAPFGDFLTVITKFFGSLKSKGRWLFNNNKLSLKIFCNSRVKTRKGGLEQKRENSQRLIGEANRRMKGQRSDNIRSSMRSSTLSKTKNLNSSFQKAFPRTLESITAGLDACQIAIFRN